MDANLKKMIDAGRVNLPWYTVQGHICHINEYGGYEAARATEGCRASYIVHACNAYAKLIGALRDQIAYLESLAGVQTGSNARMERIAQMHALLVELGEE